MPEYLTAARKVLPQPAVRALKRRLPTGIRQRLTPRRTWSIGVYGGPSPLALQPLPGVKNPVLTAADVTDVPAEFVADPFGLRHEGRWYLMFEVLDQRTNRGSIGLAVSDDLRGWTYEGIVLSEPFHLSYPSLFEWAGEIYLMPEAAESGGVRLYRTTSFPTSWELVGNVLEGPVLLDPTVFRHHDHWWMLSETGLAGSSDTLRLYSSQSLSGEWVEHPRSPIVDGDPRLARPAGRVVEVAGRLVRFAQDCYPFYGSRTVACEIVSLSETEYREGPIEDPVLAGTGAGWNATAMHHCDLHQLEDRSWVAFVDGS